MLRFVVILGTLALVTLCGHLSMYGADFVFRTVLLKEQAVPGLPEHAFIILGGAQLNNRGDLALRATVDSPSSSPQSSLWRETEEGLQLVAIDEASAPGYSPLIVFSEVSGYQLNDAGQLLFDAFLDGPGIVDRRTQTGVFLNNGGFTERVAGALMEAPGLKPLDRFRRASGALNHRGDILVGGSTSGGQGGVWLRRAGTPTLVLLEIQPVPGIGPDTFAQLGKVYFNRRRELAFTGDIGGSGRLGISDSGAWTGRIDNLQLIARHRDPAPGQENGVYFESISFVRINEKGDVAVRATTLGPTEADPRGVGLWIWRDQILYPMIHTGQPIAGAADVLVSNVAGSFSISHGDHGLFGFQTKLEGPGIERPLDNAWWIGSVENLVYLGRAGDPAPGFSGDVRLSGISNPIFNKHDQFVVRGILVGPSVSESNSRAVWFVDSPQSAFEPIVRTGDEFEVAPGDSRVVTDFTLADFNDRGEISLTLEFADESAGVFLFTRVPGMQIPGDFNQDSHINLSDSFCILRYLFRDPIGLLPCRSAEANLSLLDVNGDLRADMADPVYLTLYLFSSGPSPVSGTECIEMANCRDSVCDD